MNRLDLTTAKNRGILVCHRRRSVAHAGVNSRPTLLLSLTLTFRYLGRHWARIGPLNISGVPCKSTRLEAGAYGILNISPSVPRSAPSLNLLNPIDTR